MDKYTFDMTPEDMGEIIEMVRAQKLRMSTEAFCRELKISESLLFTVEQGKGPHGAMVLRKMHKAFPNINVGMSIEIS